MKLILRHTKSGLYFQGLGKWVEDPNRAVDFRFIDRALSYIHTWHLAEVELAFAYGTESADIICISTEKAALRCEAA